MPYFIATYAYADGSEAVRDEVRPVHREWLGTLGQLVLSGPTDAQGALLIVEGDDAAQVEQLLDGDPFAQHGGVIAERRVVGWTPVSGRLAGQV